jgi:pimeloyl-ACP methyl ester carboxylesterase
MAQHSLPWPMRLTASGLRGVGAVSSSLAARLTLALFATPLPPKWLVARRLAHIKLPASVHVAKLSLRGEHFTTYHWNGGSDAPRALLTHGWGGAARQLVPLANALSQNGWDVTVIDHIAHGASSGMRSNLPLFVQTLEYAAQPLGTLDLMVGHSMGAGACAIAMGRGLPVRRFVSIASPVSMAGVLGGFTRTLGLSDAVRARVQELLEQSTGMRLAAMEAQHNAPRITQPTLIVHDAKDKAVRFANAQQLAELIAGARLLTTEGLGHNRILLDAGVIDEIVRFAGAGR